MSESETLERFVLFTKTAQTRCGSAFVFDAFRQDEKKEIIATGKVFQKGTTENTTIPFLMEWDLKGNALAFGKQFDLITEDPFEEA